MKLERTAHRLPKGLCMGHALQLSSTDLRHTLRVSTRGVLIALPLPCEPGCREQGE